MPKAMTSRIYSDDARDTQIATPAHAAPAARKARRPINAALSDFIAPRPPAPRYIGAFVVTAGIGEDVVADRFKNANDDYSSILCKALADRLAEAFAERCTPARAANSGATRRMRR